jgi:hypothetical protein
MRRVIFLFFLYVNLFGMDPYEFHQQQERYSVQGSSDGERLKLDITYDAREKTSQPDDINQSAKNLDIFREAPPPVR